MPDKNTKRNEVSNIKEEEKMTIIIPKIEVGKAVECHNSANAYDIFKSILNYENYELKNHEHFWVMGIDSKHIVTCIYVAAMGAESKFTLTLMEVFGIAINYKSKRIVLAQNYPSKEKIEPSQRDIDWINKLYHTCKPFGLTIVDYLLIFDVGYSSFLVDGEMDNISNMRRYKQFGDIEAVLNIEKKIEVDGAKNEARKEEKIEMVKEMLNENCEIDFIVKISKLPKKEILKIKKSIEF